MAYDFHYYTRPVFTIMDPEYTVTLPNDQTESGCGGRTGQAKIPTEDDMIRIYANVRR